jgi:hypothetical protein
LAARVDELRALGGHRFETRKRPDRTVEYLLVFDAGDDELRDELPVALEESAVDDVDEQPRLFEPPPTPPLSAVLHDVDVEEGVA